LSSLSGGVLGGTDELSQRRGNVFDSVDEEDLEEDGHSAGACSTVNPEQRIF
jgi:hypothetical protein